MKQDCEYEILRFDLERLMNNKMESLYITTTWRNLILHITSPVIRLAYKKINKINDLEKKQKWYYRLRLLRQVLHPPGNSHFAHVNLDSNLPLIVNLCEKVGGDLYYGIEFEPIEFAFVWSSVSPSDVFFDVGANIGIYSLAASRLVGSSGNVHAFEPIEQTFKILEKNLALNKTQNVIANCMAVGEAVGNVEIFVNEESVLTSIGQTKRGKVIDRKTVPVLTLDKYAEEKNISEIDFLKIDVEGYEGQVLRGSEKLITRSKDLLILCELSERNYSPLDLSVNDVLEWIQEKGFEVWEVPENGQPPRQLENLRDSYEINNFIFVHSKSEKKRYLLDWSL